MLTKARILVLSIGLGFLIAGLLFMDGARDVWSKAVTICMECVGLG